MAGLALGTVAACGDTASDQASSTAAGGAAGSSSLDAGADAGSSSFDAGADAAHDSTIDCSAVGCSPPPLCSEGCQAVCGCCACAEGSTISIGGTVHVCRGGCYAPSGDAATSAWDEFTVSTSHGPCPQGRVCSSSWEVAPDGALRMRKEGADSMGRMSAEDLRALDAILRDPEFVRRMGVGFDCPVVFDVSVAVTLAAPEPRTQNVTGCVVGSQQTPVARAVDLVTSY
jgi:hypothetical protein